MLKPAKDFFVFAGAAGFTLAGLLLLAMGVLTASLQPWPPAFMGQLSSSAVIGILGALGVALTSIGIMDDPVEALVA